MSSRSFVLSNLSYSVVITKEQYLAQDPRTVLYPCLNMLAFKETFIGLEIRYVAGYGPVRVLVEAVYHVGFPKQAR